MLNCYISARARRKIATDIIETAAALDVPSAYHIVSVIVDEPANANASTDTHFGEPIIESASASDTFISINEWTDIEMWPQGRLTLQSATAVQTADQTAKTTIYYDSFVGELVPVWNGSIWQALTIGSNEISMGLDAGVPRITSGSLYDIFAISSSGILVIAAGPAWSSTTTRGTGAGTTELQLKNGLWTNKNALTHAYGGASGTTDYGSVAANQATYLGTLYATANGQTGIALKPAAAAGGSNTIIGLYNAFNRIVATVHSQDNTASWTYASTTWRAANNSNSNRITYVDGLANVPIAAQYFMSTSPSASGVSGAIGINLDSTSSVPNTTGQGIGNLSGGSAEHIATDQWYPSLGLHYVQAMEVCSAATSVSFFGAAPTPTRQLNNFTLQTAI